MGLGVLAKGPIGFLLPMAMIGMFGLWKTLPASQFAVDQADQDQTTSWFESVKAFAFHFIRCFHPLHFVKTLWAMRPLTAAAIILVISLPWFIWAHIRTEGDFTQLFFVGEHLVRATKAMENHSGGVLFYPLMILVGFFPWSCFWGPVSDRFFQACVSFTARPALADGNFVFVLLGWRASWCVYDRQNKAPQLRNALLPSAGVVGGELLG